jgi:hypothetical protein
MAKAKTGTGSVLEEAARELEAAAHDARVVFDCLALGELDRAHTSALTARVAADAAVTALQAALLAADTAAGSWGARAGGRRRRAGLPKPAGWLGKFGCGAAVLVCYAHSRCGSGMGGGDVRWHDRGWPDPVARGPGTDAEGVAAATFRVCREFPDLGAGAAALPLAGEPPALPPPGPATARHPQARRARRGPTTEGGPRHLAKEQVNHVHSAPTSPGRRALAVILAVIGVLAIIAGILYLAGAANSLHFMVGSVHKGHHLVRAAVSFAAGVALLAGAWFVARAGPTSR